MKKVTDNLSKNANEITFVDLFSGIGAFHQAMGAYGAKCVFACDIDKQARKTYKKNYGITPAGDITKIKAEDIPAHDILCAGFPCQSFSIAGKQEGFADKTRGTLFFEIVRIAAYHKPAVIFLENVKHLVNHDGGKTMKTIKSELEKLGYTVFYKVLNAAKYGVPQARERVYIVAFNNSLGVKSFDFPAAVPLTKHLIDILEADSMTAKYAVTRKGATWRPVTEAIQDKPLQIGQFDANRQGYRIYSPLGTAITLTASAHGLGGATGLYRVNNTIRCLSPRECARCMGFPDSFILPEHKTTAWRQFGNSIVVDVLQYIIEEILNVPEVSAYIENKVAVAAGGTKNSE